MISTSRLTKDVANAYGVGAETLRKWLIKYREEHGGTEEERTVSERARLKAIERENQELRAETAFLTMKFTSLVAPLPDGLRFIREPMHRPCA